MNKKRLIPKNQNPFGTIDYPIYDSNIQSKANQAQLIDSNANWLKGYLDNGVAGLKSIPDRITNYLGNIVEDISKPFGTEEGRRMSQALRANGKYIDENNKTHYTPNQFVVNPMIFSIAPNSKVITLKQALDDSKGLDFFGWLKNGKAHYRLQNPTNNSFSSVVQMGDDVMVDVPNYLSDIIISQKVPTYTVGRASKIARRPNTKKLLSKPIVEEQTVKPATSNTISTKKSLLQSIEQKLRDEKRIGISNGQTITVNGEPQTWYLEKDRLTGKLIFKQAAKDATDVKNYPFNSFAPGADPKKPITNKSKIEAAKEVKNEKIVKESSEGPIEPEVIDDEIMAELQDKMSPSERSQMRTHLNNNITRGYGKRIKYGARKAWNEFKLEMWRKYGRR